MYLNYFLYFRKNALVALDKKGPKAVTKRGGSKPVMLKSRWQLIIAVYLSAVYKAIAIITKKLK